MCGICGFTYLGDEAFDVAALLEKMVDRLQHRGPDERGSRLISDGKGLAFGHSRLAIIDLASGKQPMCGFGGKTISYNGEIYNYLELKSDLEADGYVFETTSDTEVVLAAYDKWGEQCLERFNGMFSLALHDPGTGKLLLARDRLGKKPLYYYHHDGLFIFASEIKAILVHPAVRPHSDLDYQALSDYLSLGYITAPKTIFKHIRKLSGGHCMEYDIGKGTSSIRRYWQLDGFYLAEKVEEREAEERFYSLLQDSVRLRMRSDVPLGAFLSGGIDSSSIVACMEGMSETEIKAFCVRLKPDSFDESDYARMVADHLGVGLEVLEQSMPTSGELSKLVWHLDEPFSDTSIVPTYAVCKAARQHATVVLSGDGADELLAGYVTYSADSFYRWYSKLPRKVQNGMIAIARSTIRPSYKKLSWDYKLRHFLDSAGMSPERAHYSWRTVFSDQEKLGLFSSDMHKELAGYDPFDAFHERFGQVEGADFLDKSLFVDISTWLQDGILVKVDRMSMANSLEVRSPFLDHRLVELAARLPRRFKMSARRRKVVLKQCMSSHLPRAAIDRSKKGFTFPAHLIGKTAAPLKNDLGLFNSSFSLSPEKDDVTYKSFNLLVLNIWLDMYSKYRMTGEWEPISHDIQ